MIFFREQISRITITIFIVMVSCLASPAEVRADSPGCVGLDQGRARVADQVIVWKNGADAGEVDALRSWCEAVGPPVFEYPPTAREKVGPLDTLIIVSWNTHVGSADLSRFVQDLRSGKFTQNQPVKHFVLLLQEVFRRGSDIPANMSPNAKTGESIHPMPPRGERIDIVETSKQLGLGLLYVPSMRNGKSDGNSLREDRGNAILSSLPLLSPIVVELPLERQRRVAMAARVSGESTSGKPWTVQLINVHLENRARWRNVFRTFGKARLNQIDALLRAMSFETPAVLAGDLNTWYGQAGEPAVRRVREIFRQPETMSRQGTVKPGPFLPDRVSDYIFFDIPNSWQAEGHRADELYGSDHYPLIGILNVGQ
jgi:endonuclease/exonuclease/phosphatase family metal-dependent hydrolase